MPKQKIKTNSEDAIKDLKKFASAKRAAANLFYFKTQVGGYGEGDKFLGVNVPSIRRIAKKHHFLPTKEIANLLKSEYHEARFLALIILIFQFENTMTAGREAIIRFYLENAEYVNNWDLVDVSAPRLLGAYLYERDRRLLYQLANSNSFWKRRMSIVATLFFINRNDLVDTFKIAEILMKDDNDLIHKAVGWMLRECGKKNMHALRLFLDNHKIFLPRITLRYAIEKMSESERKKYLVFKN